MRRAPDRRPLSERFHASVQHSDGCWEWTGLMGRYGYGRIHVHLAERARWGGTEHMQAHRLSYLLNVGPIPDGLSVCHHCDNRRCVRPDHLFLGTAKDNARDMARKGRVRNGRGEWTHCIHGHPLSGDNLVGRKGKKRTCKTCSRLAMRERRARQRNAA